MQRPTGQCGLGPEGWRPKSCSRSASASQTARSEIREAGRASATPPPTPRRVSTRPARRRSASTLRTTTGFVLMLRARAAEVTGPPRDRSPSRAIIPSACRAMVKRLVNRNPPGCI
jgi:hypothetical protein